MNSVKDIKKRGIVLLSVPQPEASRIAYLMNRQRQSPRRYELCTNPLETYINNGFAPNKGAKLAYKVSRESDKITPGASTVAKFKTLTGNFARISGCLKHSVE